MIAAVLWSSPGQACEGSPYSIWIPRDPAADALYLFTKDGKAGSIDQTGKILIRPKFRHLDYTWGAEFHEGLLEIGVSAGLYVDRTGKIRINKGLYRGRGFSEGLGAAMRSSSDKWGYIDASGKFSIAPQFVFMQE